MARPVMMSRIYTMPACRSLGSGTAWKRRSTWQSSCWQRPTPLREPRGWRARAARVGEQPSIKRSDVLGGNVEAFYFAFGDNDVFIIADFPDNVAAASFSLAVNSTGALRGKVLAVLLTPEEVDQAAQKVRGIARPAVELRSSKLDNCT